MYPKLTITLVWISHSFLFSISISLYLILTWSLIYFPKQKPWYLGLWIIHWVYYTQDWFIRVKNDPRGSYGSSFLFLFSFLFFSIYFLAKLRITTSEDLLCVIKADNFLAHHKIEDSICIFLASLPNAMIVLVLTKPFHESSNWEVTI